MRGFAVIRRIAILAAMISICACAQNRAVQKEFSPHMILPLSEFKTLNTTSDLVNSVAYLEPGDAVPLKLSIASEWLEIKQKEVELVARRKIFLRISLPENISRARLEKLVSLDDQKLSTMSEAEQKELFQGVMLYLSKDAVHWTAFNDKRTLKELFDIREGSLSFGMGMNANEGLWTALGIKLSKK